MQSLLLARQYVKIYIIGIHPVYSRLAPRFTLEVCTNEHHAAPHVILIEV